MTIHMYKGIIMFVIYEDFGLKQNFINPCEDAICGDNHQGWEEHVQDKIFEWLYAWNLLFIKDVLKLRLHIEEYGEAN